MSGMDWFDGAGLGIFIHWDHIAQQGCEIGWPIVGSPVGRAEDGTPITISVEQYHSTATTFNPTQWDADKLAAMIARTGARYAVLTTRHHDGYCMYHSNVSDFGIAGTAFDRDITAEYVHALRAAGVKVGFYYSLSDWHHPDYPAFTDADRPYPDENWARQHEAGGHIGTRLHRRPTSEAWQRYLEYVRAQLTELLTNYGTIDLLWFDGDWERSPQEWDAAGLRKLIKSLQPDIVINDRLPDNGDYQTPEQGLPADVPDGPWELCLTIGRQWAYRPDETKIKSPRSLVAQLAETVSLGGNLLLNIGPDALGEVPSWQRETLDAIADWMDRHGPAVLSARPAPEIRHYGPVTADPTTIYLHLVHRPVEVFTVRNVPVDRVRGVRLMADDTPLDYSIGGNVRPQRAGGERVGDLSIAAPDPSRALMDVVAIDLEPR